jgi:hypothetical protein
LHATRLRCVCFGRSCICFHNWHLSVTKQFLQKMHSRRSVKIFASATFCMQHHVCVVCVLAVLAFALQVSYCCADRLPLFIY